MPTRDHHRHCPQYDGDDIAPLAERCDQTDWDCRCDLIGKVLADQEQMAECISDAAFTRGIARGAANAVDALADLAIARELDACPDQARALLSGIARILPDSVPLTDPRVAITFRTHALDQATAMLRHDLSAGYWDTDEHTERDVNTILAAWQAGERFTNADITIATLPLSLWEEAASILSAAPDDSSVNMALDAIIAMLDVFAGSER